MRLHMRVSDLVHGQSIIHTAYLGDSGDAVRIGFRICRDRHIEDDRGLLTLSLQSEIARSGRCRPT